MIEAKPQITTGYIDTHAHFDANKPGLIDADLEHAWRAGLAAIVAVGGSDRLNAGALASCRAGQGRVYAALGLDRDVAVATSPTDIPSRIAAIEVEVAKAREHRISVVAIGEMGIDLHYHREKEAIQREFFRLELDMAARLGLPVIVHSRDAERETMADLAGYREKISEGSAPGVVHCFTYDAAAAVRFVDLGFYISFSGIVTFNTASALREAVCAVPADRLLIETDSPFLAPVPLRGKRNEPANVVHVASCVAECLGVTPECVRDRSADNAVRLFQLDAVARPMGDLIAHPAARTLVTKLDSSVKFST